MTLLIYDNIFLQHDTGYGHPENAKRLENTVKYLRSSGLWDQLYIVRCATITMKYNQMNTELMRNKKLNDKIATLKKQLLNI